MAVNRLGVTTETKARKVAVISALVFISTVFGPFRIAEIPLARGAEPESTSPPLSERDKSAIRSRWNTKKIEEVLAALKEPGANLPVEMVPPKILLKDIQILARAHGVHDFFKASNWYVRHGPGLGYADLRGIPLRDCKLENANLRYSYLERADLSKCELTNADLTGANLRGANLSEAILNGAKLDHAVLIKADLSGASLVDASLRQALLYESTIVKANLTGATLEEAQFADFEQAMDLKVLIRFLGSGDIDQVSLLWPAKLSQSNLSGANLGGAILGNANLEGASLYEAMFGDTLIDVRQLERAFNFRYIKPVVSPSRINLPISHLQYVEAFHRESKRFFASNGMGEMATEYRFWEQEAKTWKPETPLYKKVLRIAFMKWPYGYGSRPTWLFYYSVSIVLIFASLYVLLTVNRKKSGIYRVHRENGQEKVIPLSWRKGLLLADCVYFSLLSFATFGYGIFQPRQWIEFFRFESVELRPVGWARILVGLEAAVGIYLLALLTTVLFGKG